nr:MAG TPA: hypothetical protein [Caudoviricetes sp.]
MLVYYTFYCVRYLYANSTSIYRYLYAKCHLAYSYLYAIIQPCKTVNLIRA